MKSLIVILGSHGDLGTEVFESLVKTNSKIVCIDQHKKAQHPKIKHYLSCNITDTDNIFQATDQITKEIFDQLIIINTIGYFSKPSFNELLFDEEAYQQSLEVNLIGPTLFINQLIAYCLKQKKYMRIVMVGSTAGHVGSLDIGYGTSKAALNGFVRSISKSLSHKNIICFGINPGIFESSMSHSVSKERQKSAIDATHIKRKGTLKEISNTVIYLALEAPDYLTGAIIPINGGQYA